MMEPVVGMVLVASTPFIQYAPPARPATSRIEAIVDRGPILELIVRCPTGTAIVSYSKIERLYCGPRGGCNNSREQTIRSTCSR